MLCHRAIFTQLSDLEISVGVNKHGMDSDTRADSRLSPWLRSSKPPFLRQHQQPMAQQVSKSFNSILKFYLFF